MNSPAKPTHTQFAILSEASHRKDRCLIPLAPRREDRKMVPGTEQSETPVPPKVDFETRVPKAAENGREIVSTG